MPPPGRPAPRRAATLFGAAARIRRTDQALNLPSNTVSESGLRGLGTSRARNPSGRIDGSPLRPMAIAASTR